MNTNPSPSGNETASPVVVEDLFLTDSFLIKGRLAGKYHRLSKMLEDCDRTFVTVEDATMIALRGSEVVRTPCVQVNTREIVFAHELLEIAGDFMQRHLAQNPKTTRIRAFYSGGVQIELAGKITPGAYESAHGPGRRWFIMQDPVLRGIDYNAQRELQILGKLSYAIVQKAKLSYIYDFS